MKFKNLYAFLGAFLCVVAVSCGNSEKNTDTSSETESSTVTDIQTETEVTKAEETTVSETQTENQSETTSETSEENVSAYGTTADFNDYITATKVTPPVWKVTDPETNNELYLMGTIHALPENFTEFPDYVMDIYENSDGVAVEYDVSKIQNDIRELIKYQQMYIYEDGSTIQEHISDETYQKAKSYFESIGAYSDMLDNFSAGYWYSQISSAMLLRLEHLSLTGVDSMFIENATNDGKEVVNIETLDIQVGAVDAYSDELVDFLMSEAIDDIDNIDEYAEGIGELYNDWASGDIDEMLNEDFDEIDELPEELKDDYEDYMNVMLYNRNKGMADKASEFLKEGKNYFFMVGSAHYAGDKGVDDLLADMGYTVVSIHRAFCP